MPRSTEVVRLELGADANAARAYGVRAQVCDLLAEGAEIDFDGIPGPHLEPLDDAAREKMAAYWKAYPGATLDPTRSLPLGQDPMLQPTFEQAMLRTLERMTGEAPASVPTANGASGPSTDKIDKVLEAIGALTAALSAGLGGMMVKPAAVIEPVAAGALASASAPTLVSPASAPTPVSPASAPTPVSSAGSGDRPKPKRPSRPELRARLQAAEAMMQQAAARHRALPSQEA